MVANFISKLGSNKAREKSAPGNLKQIFQALIFFDSIYQFSFRANWNCRGSYAAVGVPAFVYNGLTADTLNLLAMLNMSTMKSMFRRSPKFTRLATRRSLNTVHGCTPALRPRLPSSCRRVGVVKVATNPLMQGSWKVPLGECFDCTAIPQNGSTVVFGRPVRADNCRLFPFPVMMLNGLPEATSITGANVQSLSSLLTNPLLLNRPVWYTPLKTKRCR